MTSGVLYNLSVSRPGTSLLGTSGMVPGQAEGEDEGYRGGGATSPFALVPYTVFCEQSPSSSRLSLS